MESQTTPLNQQTYRAARLARDARFDGRFFVAVKTTGIYCRNTCPATPPKESNVVYFTHAIQAATAGFRPCLRCRPDSAPHSAAWSGSHAVFKRALRLIDSGFLQQHSIAELADKMAVSDRYIRQLFNEHLGVSPKNYALYQQCLLAKQLLHHSDLPIHDIAFASGFNSVRRFNDCFLKTIRLTPSQVRRSEIANGSALTLRLHYRPPYDWSRMQAFLSHRLIEGMEWIGDNHYGRCFERNGSTGHFTAKHMAELHGFQVTIHLKDLSLFQAAVQQIRRVLDLDADMLAIETMLRTHFEPTLSIHSGLRLPGIWGLFEAGVRAILGQQVSVKAAQNLVTELVRHLGETVDDHRLFPTPEAVRASDLSFIKMPGSRKQTLHNLANHFIDHPESAKEPDSWLNLKGIGPWTVDYAKMRGLSDPDIYLGGDLGVKKAVADKQLSPKAVAPWRSYLTFQLWNQ